MLNKPRLSRLSDQPLTTRQKLAAHMENYTVSEFIQALVMSEPFGRK